MTDIEKGRIVTAESGRAWGRFGVNLTFPTQGAAIVHIHNVKGNYPNAEFRSVERGGVWVIEWR